MDSGAHAVGGFDGAFHLHLSGADKDMSGSFDVTALQDNMLHIAGFDSGDALDASNSHNDTVSFSGTAGDYVELLDDAGSVADFLTAADAALDGSTKYYFGVVGEDGYLAYDDDGDGITQVIEFAGLTDFDHTRIIGATPVI
jgi:hypothetical protein